MYPKAFIATALIVVSILTSACTEESANTDPATAAAAKDSGTIDTAAAIDTIFAEWDKPGSPGASVAVIKDGEIVFSGGYGDAQLEYGVPITADTVFHVASVSKQFTAFAIAMLADQGKLSLDDDIRQYLPYVPDFGQVITIRNLGNHTSGLRDQWNTLALAGWRLDDVITLEHVTKLVARQRELNFPPGDQYLYSNTGFTLLGDIVTRVSGTPFPEWMATNVFTPLGMDHTLFYDDHERIVPNRAYSFSEKEEGGYQKSVLSYANVGATSLFTTSHDLALWLDNYATARVGGPTVIEAMLEEGVLNNGEGAGYSLGVAVGDYRGLKRVSHSGGDAGFRSFVIFFPEHRLGINVLSNQASFSPTARAFEVAELYLGEFLEPEDDAEAQAAPGSEADAVEVDIALLEAYAGTYEFTGGAGAVFTFFLDDNKFMVRGSQLPTSPLTPISDTDFYLSAANVTLSFATSETGTVVSLTPPFFGDAPAARIEEVELGERELARYAGRYYSAELDTAYRLEVRDGALVAVHSRHSDIELMPTGADRFAGGAWFFGEARFERDAAGQPVAMLVSSGRTLNLRFDRE